MWENKRLGSYKVSIITVSYNSADTIEQTIQSVVRQSYKEMEYIMIDGASTDGTQEIIGKYAGCLGYYVSEKDDGLYDAMNKGIKRASGDIIGIINSDDWYEDGAVEHIVQYFEDHPDMDAVYGNMVIRNEYGEETLDIPQPLGNFGWMMPFGHSSVFVKKGIYEKFGVFDTQYKIASDHELLLRFYINKVRFGYLDRIVAYFRLGGLSTRKVREVIEEKYLISKIYAADFPNHREIADKIEEIYEWGLFEAEILLDSRFLPQQMNRYFHEDVKNIIIFGTGIWGERCRKALEGTGVKIMYLTDNNQAKWDTEYHGVKIINPDELKDMAAYVLIAVKEYGEEIRKQLGAMGNGMLKYVGIDELKKVFKEDKKRQSHEITDTEGSMLPI